MKFRIMVLFLILGLVMELGFTRSKSVSETEKNGENILAMAKKMNSEKYTRPSTSYRKGHVSDRSLESNALSKTEGGYNIKLPGNYPIPTPTVYDGKLLVSGGFGSKQFYCFDAASGKTIWAKNLDDDGPTSAAIEDGVVVFNTESCTIFALDANTGKMLWSWWLGDPLASTPAIADGKVFTSYPANGQGQQSNSKRHPEATHILGCFDLRTGKILWQKWIDGDAMNAPVVDGKELYITTFPGTVYKINTADGEILSAIKARATSAPTVVGKNVFYTKRNDFKDEVREAISKSSRKELKEQLITNDKSAVYLDSKIQEKTKISEMSQKLDAGNGFNFAPAASGYSKAAANIGQGRVSSMQAFQGSRILNYRKWNYNCMGDELLCSEPGTGKAKWRIPLKGDLKKEGGFLAAPPVAANGQIIIATLDGRILQVDAESGRKIKEHQINATTRFQPIVVDGRIYVSTQDSRVFCLDTGDPKLTGWPMYGGNAAHTAVK